MAYIETLLVGGFLICNPGHRNTSTKVVSERTRVDQRNRRFLASLFKTYPGLNPRPVYVPPRKRTRDEVLAANRKDMEARRNGLVTCFRPLSGGVISAVADWFGITAADITGRSRLARMVSARFVAVKLLSELRYDTGERRFSYPMIGQAVGDRDHSTILHALNTFEFRCRAYPEMRECYEALRG